MKIETKIFSSKISKRIFLTFVISALLPVVCLATIAYFQVTRNLQEQTIKNLRHAVKFQTQELNSRLNDLENELEIISSTIEQISPSNVPKLDDRFRIRLLKYFNSLAIFENPKQLQAVVNTLPIKSLQLESDDVRHLSEGHTLLVELNTPHSEPSIIMLRQTEFEKFPKSFVIGEINLNYLWGISEIDNLPLDAAYCILDSSNNLLFYSTPDIEKIESALKSNTKASTIGHFEFSINGEKYFASYSELFLKPTFKLPHWTIILFKAKSDVFAPAANFRMIFPLIIVLTLLVVLWLSNISIRKNLVPIKALRQGAQRITQRDFSSNVIVSSNDEFEELAAAFNKMSDALENKFKTLSAKSDIDRAILANLNKEEIIKATVIRITDCIACDVCGISLITSHSSFEGRAFHSFGREQKKISAETVRITLNEFEIIKKNPDHFTIQPNEPAPHYIPAKSFQQIKDMLMLPIWVKGKLSAVLWIGGMHSKQFTEEDITLSRQLADQIAVGLSNSNLIEELREMNWGALHALARAVDAKSPWTAGHSLRVSDWALKIGAVLKLQSDKLENLHRAALLHDIGKLGISSAILNKPAKLSDEEYALIKRHPDLGAKILEPINAYKEIIPMVAQHHERFDGLGYPARLAGDEIHKGAKILAVADVFDALSADRPYRKGLALTKVLDLMKEEAGRQFDPIVVKALLKAIKREQQKAA